MIHRVMFDDTDPILARVRAVALAFPTAAEKVSRGRPAFFTKKVFAYYGWVRKSPDGTWIRHDSALVICPDPDERLALLDDGAWAPPYLATAGWVAIDLDDERCARLEEYLDMSFRRTAPPAAVAQWDSSS